MLEREKNIRLPLRCEPIPGESVNGFIARLAQENSFDKAAWVAEAAGVRFPQAWYRDDEVERLAALVGREFSELRAIAATPPRLKEPLYVTTILGHDIPTEFVVRDRRRVCPKCLSGSAHHRAIWDLRLVRSCIDHGIRLLEGCPKCGRQLDWRTASPHQCNCGSDLRLAEGECVPQETQAGTRFLQAFLLGAQPPVPVLLHGLEFEHMSWLLWKFGWFRGGGISAVLDDGVDSGTERWIACGLAALSQAPEELEWHLKISAMRWSPFPARKTIARLEEVQVTLAKIGPRAGTLADILDRVLHGPPDDPRGA